MALNAGTAFLTLQLKGQKNVENELKQTNNKLASFGKLLTRIGALYATVFVARKVGDIFSQAIKNASDMQETLNKFNVVFGENSKEMKKFSDEMAAGFGRSKEQVARFLSSAQDLLVPMGLSQDAATGMSKNLAALAMDLASFNNAADADVMRDLQSALTGSGEVMKKYGVILTEAALKQELLNMGLDPTTASNAQKAMARYNIILAGTTAAQGDVARSGESFANQSKAITARITDLLTTIGESLLPILEKWMLDLQAVFGLLSDVGDEGDGVTDSMGFLAEALKAVTSPVEILIRVFKFLSGVWKLAQSLATELAEKVIWLAEKLVNLAVMAQDLAEDYGLSLGLDSEGLTNQLESLKAQREALNDLGKEQFANSGEDFESAFGSKVRQTLDRAREDLKETRKQANTDFKKLTRSQIAKEGKKTVTQVRSGGRLESLEATSAAAFNKFFQTKQEAELDELKKLNKQMAKAPIARVQGG